MQKAKWEREYTERKDLPSSRTDKPSRALREFLESHQLPDGLVLDIGSGLGRNAFYLARMGRKVIGIDIVEQAIAQATKKAQGVGLSDRVGFRVFNAGDVPWPFPDREFILSFDMMTLHVLDETERTNYARELIRTLKPDGYYIFYTIAADSPAAQELFKSSPGPEPNSYIIPQSGMIEKCFTPEELTFLFSPLKVEKIDRKTEFTPAFGDIYERVYYAGVMQK